MERRQALIVAATFAYMLLLAVAMKSLSYDIWGALALAPAFVLITVPLLRWTFRGDLAYLRQVAAYGLIAKLAGTVVRYRVAYDAYGGNADALDYHAYAANYRGSILGTLPVHTGTRFIKELTAFLYQLIGTSQLTGFLTFALMGYWGAVLFFKAAVVAVPRLAKRRYAILLFFCPSLVYWPSAIGKEAWMMLCLGLATYGIAVLTSERWRWRSVAMTALGFLGAAQVRPHFATMWIGAFVVCLVGRSFATSPRRWRRPLASLLLLTIAVAGLVATLFLTLGYLDPDADTTTALPVTDRITAIFDETERRTEQGGSGFTTIKIHSPLDVPGAIFRTLTRPLPNEATSFAQMLPAIETTLLFVLLAINWKRVFTFHRLMRYAPYLMMVPALALEFGLAFTKVGNLGILTRQRSLILPILLLVPCAPVWAKRQHLRMRADAGAGESGEAASLVDHGIERHRA